MVHLGAFKSQLVATTVPYIYIYNFHVSCYRFYWGVFARPMHSTSPIRKDVSEQVCVTHLYRCKTSMNIYIYILAGGHRGPWEVGDQRRHLPGTRVNVPAGLW